MNKPSKDATDSSSIRELTSKLKNVEKEMKQGEDDEDDKLSEVVLSATNTSGLSATFVTDVVTGEAKGDEGRGDSSTSVGKRMSTVLMAKALAKGVKDKLSSADKTAGETADANQSSKNEVGHHVWTTFNFITLCGKAHIENN